MTDKTFFKPNMRNGGNGWVRFDMKIEIHHFGQST